MWSRCVRTLGLTALWRSLFVGLVMMSFASSVLAETEDETFDNRVRDYILAHPEVILEALETLSKRENRAKMAAKISQYPDLFAEPPTLTIGTEGASIRVVEFFDYRCAPCKALHPKLTQALQDYPNVQVEMRHLPILTPGSERAARFALAVKNTAGAEIYKAVHHALWTAKGPLRAALFERISEQQGLDWAMIDAEMKSDAVSNRIARNRDIAIDLEILGTPAFVTPTSVSFGGGDAGVLIEGWLSQ